MKGERVRLLDGRIESGLDCWMYNKWMEGWMDGWMNEQISVKD